MAEDESERPWWERDVPPEPMLPPRARKYRSLIAVTVVVIVAAFVAYFIWVGMAAAAMPR